jgi:hypothetical protein
MADTSTVPRNDITGGVLSAWCDEHLTAVPKDVLFRSDKISRVVGLRGPGIHRRTH